MKLKSFIKNISYLIKNFISIFDYALKTVRFRWLYQENLNSFYFKALWRQTFYAEKERETSNVNYYKFGVGEGRTLLRYIRVLRVFCKYSKRDLNSYQIFCFDSFEGLPEKKSIK